MKNGVWHKIDSPQNPLAKRWEQSLESRGLKKNGEFLLAGRKSVPEALRTHPQIFHAVLAVDPEDTASLPLPPHIEQFQLSRTLFNQLDVSGTGFPLLAGKVPAIGSADLSAPPKGLELVCALSDPSNLGALLRSAASFGVARVVLLEECAHPFHPKTLRAGANAQFELELLRGPQWESLNDAAGPVFALDAGGEDMTKLNWPQNLRLVLGEEGKGLPASLKVRRLSIPTTGKTESLNATVAASLALFQHYLAAGSSRLKGST